MKAFLTAMLIVGTIIGAGFASGSEIAVYFARFGYWSIPAVIFAGVLFYFSISALLKANLIARSKGIGLNSLIFGKFSVFVEFVMIFICFIMLSSMFAGSDVIGASFFPGLGGFPVVSVILFVLCFLSVRFGIKGLMRVNAVLVPVILIFIMAISLYGVYFMPKSVNPANNSLLILLNPFIYAGMNMMLAIGAIREIKINESEIKRAAFISTILLTLIMLVSAIAIIYTGTTAAEMPFIVIASKINLWVKAFSALIIIIAIFTTMQTAAYTLSGWMNLFLDSKSLSIAAILTISWGLSRIGFSNIVTYIYPLAGYAGIIYFAVAFIALRRAKKSTRGFNDKLLNNTKIRSRA